MECDALGGKVSDLIAAGVMEIGDGYRAKNSELSDEGFPFARAANINGGFRFDGADRFPVDRASSVGKKLSRPGDVVFTSKGTVGRFAFVTADVPQFVYSPQLCYWRSLEPQRLNPRYLYFWMQSQEFLHQIGYLKNQTDMADYVSLRDQREMTLTIPDPDIQRSIADFLGAIESRIDLLRQTNTTLEAIAQALFKSWFVDFDLVHAKAEGRVPEVAAHGRADAAKGRIPIAAMDAATAALFPSEFEESELGLIPKGWKARSLDSIATYLNGLALQKFPAESESEFLPVIKIAQLRAGNTAGSDRASGNLKPEYVVHDGDVLFSWSGSLEVEFWCGGDGALNQHLFKVTSDEVPKWFYYLATRIHLPEFRRVAAGKATTMGHIQRKHLAQAKVAVPPPRVLAAATEIIEPLLERRISNSLQMRELAQLRDALLPRLISGKLRLPEAMEATQDALA